jgi:hypothetical protein
VVAVPIGRRLVRAALCAIDLRRRPPDEATRSPGLLRALAALRRPPVPRTLRFITVKRINPRVGDTFGHWWIELDRVESYGWWPARRPVGLRVFLFGTRGTLNGGRVFGDGRPSARDPHHLDNAHHEFHPKLLVRKSDRQVRADIRAFAETFESKWRWSARPTTRDCRQFQLALFEAVGLDDGEHLHTRGRGCPFLGLFGPRRRSLTAS